MTVTSSGQPAAPRPVIAPTPQLQATTDIQGFQKVNGTPNILRWQVPPDSQMHRFTISATENVTALETGGQVSYTFTPPAGAAVTVPLFAAASGAGANIGNGGNKNYICCAPGTAVTVDQTSALTAGGPSVVFAEIWGS